MRRTGTRLGFAAALIAAGLAASTAALAQGKTLRIGAQADAGTLDPQAQNIQTTITLLSWIYEPLVTRDKALAKAPALATSWELTNPTTWRFKLRPNVKFHDGAAFGADDVAFSIARTREKTSQFLNLVASIKEAKVVDDLTIDLVTDKPDPLIPDKMTYVFIMDRDWAEKNNVKVPQDLRNKQETYAVLHANGTGPYRVQSREPDTRTVLAKNPAYWGKLDGDIATVVFTPIGSDPTRVAALVSGELDLVIDVPSQDVARLSRMPELKLAQVDEFRTLFFGFDLKNDKLKYGEAPNNPFKDKRVREAVNKAIDMEAIAKSVMRGLATPTGQILAPGNIGYDKALDKRPAYDPAGAKKLLAEAGYPEGFAFTFDCPNDRYINDEQVCKAVAAMLAQAGFKPNLNLMPRSRYFPKIWDRDTSMFLMGFNSPYFDGMYALETLLMTRNEPVGEGIYNYANFSNPDYDRMIAAARDELDPKKREQMMKDAYRKATEDVIYVPLHHQVLVYAMKKTVSTPVRPDNWLDIRWVRMD